MSSYCACPYHTGRSGVFLTVLKLLLFYLVAVFAGGTLINTGHPVAVEVGQIIRLLTFVDPAIQWAQSNEWTWLASGLRMLADGAPVTKMFS